MTRENHHKEFPRQIARLSGLEGGAYGEIVLKAITRRQMELDLGNEFVLFTRDQACALRDAVHRFLEFDERFEERREERHEVKEIEEAIEELAEDIVNEAPPRRRRPRG